MPRRATIGLDIGTSAVRAAEVSVRGGVPRLLAAAQVPLPPQTVVDGVITDLDAVESALRHLWKRGGFTSTRVRLGVSGNRAVARRAEVGLMPDSELAAGVRFLAEEIVPQFAPEETFLSPLLIGAVDGDVRRRRVLVAAAHRDLVLGRVEVATRAGLQVEGVEPGPAALARAFAPGDPERAEAVVVVGAGQSSVIVHRGGLPLLMRTVPLAGAALTAAVAGGLGLAADDAEAVKRARRGSAPAAAAAVAAMAPVVSSIVGEIRAALDLFAQEEGEPVARVVLTGGAIRLQSLAEAFGRSLRCPVVIGDVSSTLEVRCGLEPEALTVLGVAVGLALPGSPRFDLLPDEVRERNALRQTKKLLVALGAAVVVLLAGAAIARSSQVERASRQLADTQGQVAHLNARVSSFDAVVATTNQLAAKRAEIRQVLAGEVDWPTVVDQLARRMPLDVSLASISGQVTSAPPAGTTTSSSASAASAAPPPSSSSSPAASAAPPPSSSSSPAATASATVPAGPGSTAASTAASTLPAAGAVIGTLTVQGSASDFHGGASWIVDLSRSPVFNDVFVSSLSRSAGAAGAGGDPAGTVSFSSTLDVLGAAHSVRYRSYGEAGK